LELGIRASVSSYKCARAHCVPRAARRSSRNPTDQAATPRNARSQTLTPPPVLFGAHAQDLTGHCRARVLLDLLKHLKSRIFPGHRTPARLPLQVRGARATASRARHPYPPRLLYFLAFFGAETKNFPAAGEPSSWLMC
jgi:hypothetical protein